MANAVGSRSAEDLDKIITSNHSPDHKERITKERITMRHNYFNKKLIESSQKLQQAQWNMIGNLFTVIRGFLLTCWGE